MNVLSEMTTLAAFRPTADASHQEIASWLEAKARLREHLAGVDVHTLHRLSPSTQHTIDHSAVRATFDKLLAELIASGDALLITVDNQPVALLSPWLAT